jgi:hypothetical protein
MAQQTAVEWLIEQLNKNENIRWRGAPVLELTEQAKAMEKEQILNACYQFSDYPFTKEDHLEYYNETYKQ